MKSLLFKIAAFAALATALLSCSKEAVQEVPASDNNGKVLTSFSARIGDSDDTRLLLSEADGKLLWEPGDDAMIYGGGNLARFCVDVNEPAGTATFTGSLDISGMGEDDYYYCIHPAFKDQYVPSFYHDGVLTVPVTNDYYDARFEGKGLIVMEAYAHMLPGGESFPMISRSKDAHFTFHNVCGGIKFSVARDDIFFISIKNNDGGMVWGYMDVEFAEDDTPVFKRMWAPDEIKEEFAQEGYYFDEFICVGDDGHLIPGEPYYIVLPPITFSEGMTVTFRTPTKEAVYEVPGSFSIERSVFSRLTQKDKELEFKTIEGNIPFEDENFKQYMVENWDKDGDGEISYAEAEEVTSITWHGAPDEMMYFINLESLDVHGKSTDEECDQIHRIDISRYPKLRTLRCQYNSISKLDLKYVPDLDTLVCAYNNLSSLDLSHTTHLKYINCGNNPIPALDVSSLHELTQLHCFYNELSTLDVSGNPLLVSLSCYGNKLSSLDVSMLPGLLQLRCQINSIETLDLSSNPELLSLACYENKLSSLNLSANKLVQYLWCYRNELGSLDLEGLSDLHLLSCFRCGLQSLNLSGCTGLIELYCYYNELQDLDVSGCHSLRVLRCGNNKITQLDLRGNDLLEDVYLVAEWWYSDGRVEYSDGYDTYLHYVTLPDGIQIKGINVDRTEKQIPYPTVIRYAGQANDPMDDFPGQYNMSSTILNGTIYEIRDWNISITPHEDTFGQYWLTPITLLFAYYYGSFPPEDVKIYAWVCGDGNSFRIPLPQTLNVTDSVFGLEGKSLSMYLWDKANGVYDTSSGIVEFIRQEDGSFTTDQSFGCSLDPESYYFDTQQPLYSGAVNYYEDGTPIVIKKDSSDQTISGAPRLTDKLPVFLK